MSTIAWESAEYFAKLAAVLGVQPDMVMAAYGDEDEDERPGGFITVLYTREEDRGADDPFVWMATIDQDDGLHVFQTESTGRRFSSFLR